MKDVGANLRLCRRVIKLNVCPEVGLHAIAKVSTLTESAEHYDFLA